MNSRADPQPKELAQKLQTLVLSFFTLTKGDMFWRTHSLCLQWSSFICTGLQVSLELAHVLSSVAAASCFVWRSCSSRLEWHAKLWCALRAVWSLRSVWKWMTLLVPCKSWWHWAGICVVHAHKLRIWTAILCTTLNTVGIEAILSGDCLTSSRNDSSTGATRWGNDNRQTGDKRTLITSTQDATGDDWSSQAPPNQRAIVMPVKARIWPKHIRVWPRQLPRPGFWGCDQGPVWERSCERGAKD